MKNLLLRFHLNCVDEIEQCSNELALPKQIQQSLEPFELHNEHLSVDLAQSWRSPGPTWANLRQGSNRRFVRSVAGSTRLQLEALLEGREKRSHKIVVAAVGASL